MAKGKTTPARVPRVATTQPRHAIRGSVHAVLKRTGSSLGLTRGSVAQFVQQLETGLPFRVLEKLHDATGLSLAEVAARTRISDRTLARRKREGRFNLDESERILRIATVFERAVDLFEGDRTAAMQWLQRSRDVFGGATALEFAETEVGAREVEDVIERIEYGVIA
jgi:putative toxin-antitoxin system antitoxin component (TIGR02293 family)